MKGKESHMVLKSILMKLEKNQLIKEIVALRMSESVFISLTISAQKPVSVHCVE